MLSYLLISMIFLVISRFIPAHLDHRSSIITDGDSMGHLMYVKEYHRTGGQPIDMSYLYTLDTSDYPNGYHKLFYYINAPVDWLEKYGGYIPVFFDALLLVAVAVAIHAFGGVNYYWLLAFPLLRMFFGNSARAHHFSERAYGVLLGNVYLLSVVTFYVTESPFMIPLAIISFTLFGISSKFAWQGVTLITAALSAAMFDAFFIVAYLACLAISIILTRGYSLTVLLGLIRHSTFYKVHLAPRNPALKSNYKELLSRTSAKRYVYTVLMNSPLRIFTDNPLNLIVLFMALSGGTLDIWTKWSLVGVFLTLLISTPPLQFLGEPERYLEFSVVPTFVCASRFDISNDALIAAIVAVVTIGVFFFHYYMFAIRLGSSESGQAGMLKLRDRFSSIHGSTVLTIPFRLSFFLGYANNTNRFVTLFSNIGKGKAGDQYKWLLRDRYPFVRNDLRAVTEKFGLDFIVVHKPSVRELNETYGRSYYDFDRYDVTYENDEYVIYGVTSK